MHQRLCVLASLIVVLTGPLSPGALQAQESIWVAGATLRLGMPKTEVMSLLGASYTLKRLEGPRDGWLIFAKAGTAAPNRVPGLVVFKDDAPVSISKQWGNFSGPETVALGRVVHSLLTEAIRSGSHVARVETETQHEPGVRAHTVRFRFVSSKRTISLMVLESESGQVERTVSVAEELGE